MTITLSGLKKEKKIPSKNSGKKIDNQIIKNNLNAFKAITNGLKDTTQKMLGQKESQSKSRKEMTRIGETEQSFSYNPNSKDSSIITEGRLKVDQNSIKSRLKVDHKVDQNSVKSGLAEETSPALISESRSKVGSKVGQEIDQKQIKSGLEVGQKTPISLIVGLQKKMLDLLFNRCLEEGSKTTNFLGIHDLALALETNKNSIKSGIRQLRMKGALSKSEFKDGRSGGTKYTIPDHIYNDMLQSQRGLKVDQNQVNSRSKVDSKVDHKVDQTFPSSSNINLNSITTTEDKNLNEIQIPPILKEKGFGLSHLKQIISKYDFSISEIQGFLEAYAFDLQNDQGKKLEARGTNLIGYFFGALKNGGYNTISKDFKSSEDQAREDQLRALEERRRIREDQEKRIFELKFAEWLDTKGKEELVKLVPPMGDYLGTIHRSGLKDFFKENILDNPEN